MQISELLTVARADLVSKGTDVQSAYLLGFGGIGVCDTKEGTFRFYYETSIFGAPRPLTQLQTEEDVFLEGRSDVCVFRNTVEPIRSADELLRIVRRRFQGRTRSISHPFLMRGPSPISLS